MGDPTQEKRPPGSAAPPEPRLTPVFPLSIGVDVGGTFTDLAMTDRLGRSWVAKVPSDNTDPSRGVVAAVEALARDLSIPVSRLLGGTERFVHGSTVATNTVLEHTWARVGLVTTRGFRDFLEIRRGIREDQWDHRAPWPPVMSPRHLRRTIGGRIGPEGEETEALDEGSVAAAVEALVEEGAESVALCLLHSYACDDHERRVAAVLREKWPGHLTSVSSELVPILGEYERGSTTVANAGLVPRVGSYLERLARELGEMGLRSEVLVLQSNGGTVPIVAASGRPVELVLSGPAAVVGALGRHRSRMGGNLVSLEVGGTSCDVTVMAGGEVPVTDSLVVGGHHLAVPAVDVHTVGAGGGTVATVDSTGMLQVGPRGAGAVPGPAAYGRGGSEATVTDAQLVLGRLRDGARVGGSVVLDAAAAREVIRRTVAVPLSMGVEEAAAGILRLVGQAMIHAVEAITVQRGRDPSEFVLVAAGGAGALHGSEVARALGMRRWMVPGEAGVFCAMGMLHTDLRRDFSHPLMADLDDVGSRGLATELEFLHTRGLDTVSSEWDRTLADVDLEAAPWLELRYPGQLWSVRVFLDPVAGVRAPLPPAVRWLREEFERRYRRLYGHIQPDGRLLVTAVGLTFLGRLERRPEVQPDPAETGAEPDHRRPVWMGPAHGSPVVDVYRGADLCPGQHLEGPAVIEMATTTVLVGGDELVTVGGGGDLVVERSRSDEAGVSR